MSDLDNLKQEDVSTVKDKVEPTKSSINIIEKMRNVEEKMRDPKYKTFKKSINFQQLNSETMMRNQEDLLKEISESLLRIEAILQTLLSKLS